MILFGRVLSLISHELEDDCKNVEADNGKGRKSLNHEAWEVASESLCSITELVDNASKAIADNCNRGWEWESEEGEWHIHHDWEAVLEEMVDAPISAVVESKVTLFAKDNGASFTLLFGSKLVDEHVGSEVATVHH